MSKHTHTQQKPCLSTQPNKPSIIDKIAVKWVITHESRKITRPPYTEIITDIESWVINNPDLYITYACAL